jgi:glycosyltransferase involved in cell wall biosynthesis
MKVLHVITCLSQGGAQAVLYRLVAASHSEDEHVVVSLMDEGIYGPRLRELGTPVHILGFPHGGVTLRGLRKFWRLLGQVKPDVVQTWMYHPNLAGGLMSRLGGIRAVCWGIRNSNLSPETSSKSARFAAHLCGLLSGWLPSAIVSCSDQAARVHQDLGYRSSKFAIIPNGYDTRHFSPRPGARETLRSKWGVPAQVPILGAVARWDPQKDHASLLAALTMLAKDGIDFRCVLAGTGMERSNSVLWQLVSASGLEDKVILLGPRDDIPDVMNALDLHVLSSSYGEAFPNVVAEAMACGTPCVVTDVGDAALIVGDTGWVAPPRDPHALFRSIVQALQTIQTPQRETLSQACRLRIVERFGIERMAEAYRNIWFACAVSE